MAASKKIAPPLLAFAAGICANSYFQNHTRFPWPTNPFATQQASCVRIDGGNGISSTFESNITDEDLDAHCLNIELTRQRLQGRGKHQISSIIQGTNRHCISSFDANINEKDLDTLLDIADRMRQRIRQRTWQRIRKADTEPAETEEPEKQD
ncbi:MAG: hypothetical protein Q9200_001749 [Gallowayella weberi]